MCDTFVIPAHASSDQSVTFGKNSNREPGEAQSLEFIPEGAARKDGKCRCTHITIHREGPRNAVLLSRPFWMWGAEMGANQHGVVIGNEAVWSRIPPDRKPALVGMDLLRLALERAASAEEALEDIVRLLSDHGQGGACGYRDRSMTYHNSFIIADCSSAWVLETVGRLWAARQLTRPYAISNALTIGTKFDRAHPQLEENARKQGWVKRGQPFHFANAYSDRFYTFFSASRFRRARATVLAEALCRAPSAPGAFSLLRDHGSADAAGYRPDRHLLGSTICAHAGIPLTRAATQTVGSMVARLLPRHQTYWFTGTAAPCTTTFKPVRFGKEPLPYLGPEPGPRYDGENLWWRHEHLHRRLVTGSPGQLSSLGVERDALESVFRQEVRHNGSADLSAVTARCFDKGKQLTEEWCRRLGIAGPRRKGHYLYRRFWKHQDRIAEMPAES